MEIKKVGHIQYFKQGNNKYIHFQKLNSLTFKIAQHHIIFYFIHIITGIPSANCTFPQRAKIGWVSPRPVGRMVRSVTVTNVFLSQLISSWYMKPIYGFFSDSNLVCVWLSYLPTVQAYNKQACLLAPTVFPVNTLEGGLWSQPACLYRKSNQQHIFTLFGKSHPLLGLTPLFSLSTYRNKQNIPYIYYNFSLFQLLFF